MACRYQQRGALIYAEILAVVFRLKKYKVTNFSTNSQTVALT
jgi:hypothetical protein